MNEKKKLRNSNIELLRFILMFAICVWHMFVHGFDLKYIGTINYNVDKNYLLYCTILVPAVNCFMLISGFYGINFNIRKAISLIFQAGFYFWLGIILKYILWGDFSFNKILHIFPISTFAWWFLTIYFVIFLLSPIINTGIRNLSKKQYLMILCVLIFINSIGLYINRVSLGSNLQSLLILYLLGRYMAIYKIKINKRSALLIWIASTIILASLVLISTNINLKISWLLLSYNNILIILQAIGILYFVLSFKEKHYKPFLFLGANCFAIYLLTEGIGLQLYNLWSKIYSFCPILSLLTILIICLIIVSINFLQAKINKIVGNTLYKTIIKYIQ